ncbi:MAG: alpha/beta hydrolase [Acidobacteriia bacterium]|nr:alpha/beta hydrolase [Terriglobia bacterium]
MATIKGNGIEIYYEEHGEGQPLLLIQGLSYATPMWYWQVAGLMDSFRVITFDNRGSGQSAKPDIPYSMKMFADDAVSLLDALKISQVSVLGISMGGIIAQEVALSYPGRVTHLILCSTLFGGSTASQPDTETLAYLAEYQESVSDELSRLEIAYGTAPGFGERHPDRVAALVEFKRQSRPPRFAYFRQLMSAMGYVSETRLPSLSIPTLIIAGSEDRIIPPDNSRRLHQIIPNSKIKVFDNAGHHVHIEYPEEFNQAVIEFLSPTSIPGRLTI